jgi:hypothetical protein
MGASEGFCPAAHEFDKARNRESNRAKLEEGTSINLA